MWLQAAQNCLNIISIHHLDDCNVTYLNVEKIFFFPLSSGETSEMVLEALDWIIIWENETK